MKTRKRTFLMPLLIAASAPLISAAATGDQAAPKSEDQATATADDKQPAAKSAAQPASAADATAQAAASASAQPSKKSSSPEEPVGLQQVVVTAERRTSDVQKTGVAVSVRSGDDLLQQGKTSIRQILEDVPAVVVTENAGMFLGGSDTAGNNVTIRGIKSNNSSSGSPLPAVPTTALYTDGVYEGIGGSYDLDRVEVLRGPQGTLYGRSATSGVVSSYTRNPNFDGFSIDGTAELGSYALQHYSSAVNVPVTNAFAMRLAVDEFSRNGYDSKDGGALERTSGRLKMLYQPSHDLSVLFGAAVEKNHTHTGGVQANMTGPDSFDYTPAPIRTGTNTFQQYWLNIDWDLGPATLTYLPAVRRWDQDAEIYQNGPGGGGLNQLLKTPFDQFMTHELRLASKDTGALKWLLGGFYYDNRLHSTNDIRWLSSGGLLNESDTHKETSNTGVFGEMTYSFVDTWRATAGLRHDYTHVKTLQDYTNNLNYNCNTPIASGTPDCPAAPPESPQAGLPGNNATLSLTGDAGARKFNNTTYKLRLEHDLSKSNLLYAMVSTGFIPGDVQVAAGAGGAPAASEYGAEQLTAYEFGSKNRFLENRLQINGDVFYYDYGGFRTSIRPDPTNPGSQILVTVPAKVVGAEFELQYLLTPRDQLSLNYSYTDARFSHPPSDFTQYVAETHVAPGAVPRTLNAAYRHSFTLPGDSTLDFRADARFESAYNLDNVSAPLGQAGLAFERVPNEWTSNLSSSWLSSNGIYSVTAYVRNVTNNRYKTFTQLEVLQPLIATGTRNDPRTFGVVLTARY
jgi:outer membrane receptor protein involved in Fe transport